MVIAGLVAQIHPAEETAVVARLASVEGARYEGTPAPGHLVIVLEAETDQAAEARMQALQALPGVLGIYPAYIHSEV